MTAGNLVTHSNPMDSLIHSKVQSGSGELDRKQKKIKKGIEYQQYLSRNQMGSVHSVGA